MIEEKAFAKINLTLNVTGILENGFHSIESVMAPVDLYDSLFFEQNNSNNVIVEGLQIANNSIYTAATLFKEKYQTPGVTIKVIKRIPIEAGLAGGSADSSAVLRGLNRLFNLNLSFLDLQQMSDQLGSDNTFCLFQKAAICRQRGENLQFINHNFSFNVLLIKPYFGLKTKDVFNAWSKKASGINTSFVINALQSNDYDELNKHLNNDLFEPALRIEPRLVKLKQEIESFGVMPHMSGSGTCLYVIDSNLNKLLRLKKRIKGEYVEIHTIKNTLPLLNNE